MDGSEIAIAGALGALVRQQEAVSANLANGGTAAFKRSQAAFHTFLATPSTVPVPVASLRQDFSQGDVYATENPWHVAVTGPAFLKAQTPDGQIRYTRGGELRRTESGQLTTADGLPLLDDSGQPVRCGDGPGAPRIDERGNVIGANGERTGRLAMVTFADPHDLLPAGSGLWAAPKKAAERADEASTLQQGHLERSNTDAVGELVELIRIQRAFQGTTRVLAGLQGLDESLINALRN